MAATSRPERRQAPAAARRALRPAHAAGPGLGAPLAAIVVVVLASGLAGCASTVDLRPLATGRADASAWQLQSDDPDALQREARRLCPLGGTVLHSSVAGRVADPADSRWQRWLQASVAWMDPPRREAQMVLVCREGADRSQIAAAPVGPASAAAQPKPASGGWLAWLWPRKSAAGGAETAAAPELPVGPVMPQW